MKDNTGTVIKIVLVVVAIIALFMGCQVASIKWRGVTDPMEQSVDRKVWEQTPSHIQGIRQDLIRYRSQYLRTEDKNERRAIASTVRLLVGPNPTNIVMSLDPELLSFYNECMENN